MQPSCLYWLLRIHSGDTAVGDSGQVLNISQENALLSDQRNFAAKHAQQRASTVFAGQIYNSLGRARQRVYPEQKATDAIEGKPHTGVKTVRQSDPRGNDRCRLRIAFCDPQPAKDQGQDINMPKSAGASADRRQVSARPRHGRYFAVPNAFLTPGSMM